MLGMLAFIPRPVAAQTTAPGPYYATPSWDQTLPSSTRFIVLSNMNSNAVLDRETGLVWERSPVAPCVSVIFCTVLTPGTFTWFAAQLQCNTVAIGNRSGWRLPTFQELQSLVDRDPANTGLPRLPPGHPFVGVQPSLYWSATSSTQNPVLALTADMSGGTGLTSLSKSSSSNFVWCVRGGSGVESQ
jgi:hypothetical protein